MLKLAKRSPQTIRLYRNVLASYARLIGVPLEQVHAYLLPENLIKYAASRAAMSAHATRINLNILHRYFMINGVKFDPLEVSVLKAHQRQDPEDKPLELETLQRMMDLGDTHAKAIITSFISTGWRPGEAARILLSDVNGDTITIRNEIAKGGRGGKVYLTKEAREYLDLWLKERDEYIRLADARVGVLVDAGGARPRPENDQRLFACSYTSFHRAFSRLYQIVDGEKGKYGDRCTLRSCRRYFRTHAVQTMPLDLVEKIMRHEGYLTSSYVRISDEEARRVFHEGEHVLYITRKDHRVSTNAIEALKRENLELSERLKKNESEVERRLAETERILERVMRK